MVQSFYFTAYYRNWPAIILGMDAEKGKYYQIAEKERNDTSKAYSLIKKKGCKRNGAHRAWKAKKE